MGRRNTVTAIRSGTGAGPEVKCGSPGNTKTSVQMGAGRLVNGDQAGAQALMNQVCDGTGRI